MSNMEAHFRSIKNEIANIENKLGWNSIFQTIRSESCTNHDYPCVEARAPENKLLNRYRDVSPFDHSRVMLTNGPCSYINASLVKVERAGRNYILTQGPLPHTASHFWLMVWEQKSRAILMLNKIIEKNQIKCHQYWPVGTKGGGDDIMEFSDVGLRVNLLTEEETLHFVVRTLRIEEISSGNSREVLQFHYTTWPDFGVPSTARAFLHFLQAVRDSGALNSNVGPPVVHCSAGIGRSGTFCLVDSCLLMMEQNITVNVKDVLLDMRKFRMGLIQTSDQLRFSYLAILEGIQQLVQGQKKFMPDESPNGDGHIIDEPVPPRPPPRIESRPLPPTDADYRRIIRNGSMDVNRPLPETPSDDDDSSSVDSILNDDDSDSDSDADSDSDNLKEDDKSDSMAYPKPVPEAVEDISDLKNQETERNGKTEEILHNSHHKTNGVDSPADDAALRKRLKNEALREKIRDIKQNQREAETVQHIYRSPKPKRRKESKEDEDEESRGESHTSDQGNQISS